MLLIARIVLLVISLSAQKWNVDASWRPLQIKKVEDGIRSFVKVRPRKVLIVQEVCRDATTCWVKSIVMPLNIQEELGKAGDQ